MTTPRLTMCKIANTQDVTVLVKTLAPEGRSLANEQASDTYLDEVVGKPWGYEYRVYCDTHYDVWMLVLTPMQATSMHCHPRKETALVCLSGRGSIRFLDQRRMLAPCDWLIIGKGVFHAIENTGSTDMTLVEVEVPRNKLDLVRAQDRYGRPATTYERKSWAYGGIYSLSTLPEPSGSKLRTISLCHHYQFAVVPTKQMREQPTAPFLVGVSLSSARENEQHAALHLVTGQGMTHEEEDETDGWYWLASRRKERAS